METTQQDIATRSADEERDARRRLASISGFPPERADAARLTRLVGMTNRVYRVDSGAESFCLRIPGDGTTAAIDRETEEANARAAAKIGVAPEVIFFDRDGLMLTHFIAEAPLLRPERIATCPSALQRAAVAFRVLHASKLVFEGTFDAFGTIETYADALQRLGYPLSGPQGDLVERMRMLGRVVAERPIAPTPCHCDPTGRNLLDTGEKVWLVDWEYSGMNDPFWDLAYFSVEALLDVDSDTALLATYLGRPPDPTEVARLAVWKPACETLTGLWALIQAAEGSTAGDFTGYAEATLGRAASRLKVPEFSVQLDTLRRA